MQWPCNTKNKRRKYAIINLKHFFFIKKPISGDVTDSSWLVGLKEIRSEGEMGTGEALWAGVAGEPSNQTSPTMLYPTRILTVLTIWNFAIVMDLLWTKNAFLRVV